MPFPFAAIGAIGGAIGSAIAGAAATAAGVAATAATAAATTAVAAAPFVAAGAAVVGGIAITGAIREHNKQVQNNAYKAGQQAASKENEKRLIEEAKRLYVKVHELKEEFGCDVPQEELEKLLLGSSQILGELQGNRSGLQEKGLSASSDAVNAEKELNELQNSMGLKESISDTRGDTSQNERRPISEKRRLDKKIQNVKEKYGSNVSEEKQKQILLESSEILGGLSGNRNGLQEKRQSASSDAINAEKELRELQNNMGLFFPDTRGDTSQNERSLIAEKRRLDKIIQNVKRKYGSEPTQDVQNVLLLESSELLGSLRNNRSGLQEKRQSASSDAINAEKELQELLRSLGLSK